MYYIDASCKCAECGAVFDEPDYKDGWTSYEAWGSFFKHNDAIPICPECGSEDIEEYVEELEVINEPE